MFDVAFTPEGQPTVLIRLPFVANMTVAEALEQSGVLARYPEAALLPIGIFSKIVLKTTLVKRGDRLEVYRPLTIDPKEKRRQRARQR